MDSLFVGIGVLVAAILLVFTGVICMLRLFRKVEQGRVLIVSKIKKVHVTFTGAIVLPILHKAEIMDISVKTIEIGRSPSRRKTRNASSRSRRSASRRTACSR
jgi:uncharacterized membrane protein YqiK